MLVIPAIELRAGRSRVVSWPGASAGIGTPTDRPEVIAERFVAEGARLIHLVDLDGAGRGVPVNLEAIGRVAARVAVPLQVAGGLEGADNVRLAFAAGATRAVLGMVAADDPALVRDCVAVAGDWLGVGLDPRPDRIAAFPWRTWSAPTLEDIVDALAALGVGRVGLSHGGSEPDPALLNRLVRAARLEVLVAGGVTDRAAIHRLRDAGIAGVILGEVLLSGQLPYPAALEAAA